MSLSTRHYLADAVFLAAVEGDEALVAGLLDSLRAPHFPLYLGRRSCPPVGRLDLGLRAGSGIEALRSEPWQASPWFRRRHLEPTVALELVADCAADDPRAELVRDEPLSFDPHHRQWAWRSVRRHDPVVVDNPEFADHHDPLGVL